MKQWTEERCEAKPAELQRVAPDLYIQRRNITAEEHAARDDRAAYTDYVCESREILESEYAMLKSIEEISTDKAIDDYTEQLMQEGVL